VEDIVRQYQSSLVCVLPYTGSFAGLPASIAAANQLPVVCTRNAGLPDHLGECGVWVDEENPEQLTERIIELLGSEQLRREIGARLLKRAEDFLQWDVIAERTLRVYREAVENKGK
jgi:glycosyltransferase involved in cell wall biosynthesis